MLRQLESVLKMVDFIDVASRMGFAAGGDPSDIDEDDAPES